MRTAVSSEALTGTFCSVLTGVLPAGGCLSVPQEITKVILTPDSPCGLSPPAGSSKPHRHRGKVRGWDLVPRGRPPPGGVRAGALEAQEMQRHTAGTLSPLEGRLCPDAARPAPLPACPPRGSATWAGASPGVQTGPWFTCPRLARCLTVGVVRARTRTEPRKLLQRSRRAPSPEAVAPGPHGVYQPGRGGRQGGRTRLRHTSNVTRHTASSGSEDKTASGATANSNWISETQVLKGLYPTKGLHSHLVLGKALEAEGGRKLGF